MSQLGTSVSKAFTDAGNQVGDLVGQLPVAHASAAEVMADVSGDDGEVSEPGMTHDCGFSPEGSSLDRVLKAISEVHPEGEQKATILVTAYELTSPEVAEALVKAHDRHVLVAVVADPTENRKRASKVGYLIEHGIEVRFDNKRSMIHDKDMVLGGSTVETGSFNYTRAAASDEHAENACVFRHVPKMAAQYIRHWKLLWTESDRADL